MFLSRDELKIVGFKTVGENARISRNATFYSPDLITIGKNVHIDDFAVMSGKLRMIIVSMLTEPIPQKNTMMRRWLKSWINS